MSDFKGVHHFFVGVLLFVVGFIILVTGKKTERRKRIAVFIMGVGLAICFDDAYQHYRQYTDPSYRSLLHVLYAETLWKLEVVQKINRFFDSLFGR